MTSESPDLSVDLDFDLKAMEELRVLLPIPESLSFRRLRGKASLRGDVAFENPGVDFAVAELEGEFDAHPISARDLHGSYNDGRPWLEPSDLTIDDLVLHVISTDDGFRITTDPGVADLEPWVEGFVGDAVLSSVVDFKLEGEPMLRASIRQDDGFFVKLDPWVELRQFRMDLELSANGELRVLPSSGLANQGSFDLEGEVNLETSEVALSLFVNRLDVETLESRLNLTTLLQWDVAENLNQVSGTVYLNGAHLAPEMELTGLVQDLLLAAPELYFPDPMLEQVALQVFVDTPEPIIVENKIAYLEMVTPFLEIGGNLAEPKPVDGMVEIRGGSSVDLGNQSFVFNDSQIQFIPNRPDDPYLLVSMVTPEESKALSLNGFLSELDQNVDTNDLSNILGNYLLSRVSSMVSFETDQGKTLFDDSFTFVVSHKLGRKLVTRYAIPVVDGQQNQRFELTLGPYLNNFVTFTQRDDNLGGNLQHTRKLGYPEGGRPSLIRRIRFPEDTPRWVRRKLKLQKEQIYSPTRWRRAELDLRRRLKEVGYLQPEIDHSYEDRVLDVALDFGPRTLLEVDGLELSDNERRRLFRALRTTDNPRNLGAGRRAHGRGARLPLRGCLCKFRRGKAAGEGVG